MFRVVFPKNYVICEGHEWRMDQLWVEADGRISCYKRHCRYCELEVARAEDDLDWIS